MCPGTLAVVGLAGAAASAGGTVLGGIAQGNMSEYQATVAKNNAIIADQNAAYASAAGEAQAQAVSLKGAATAGKIKTAQAANGVDVNTGSAVNVQKSQAETSQLDTETTLNNAELQVHGYRANAMNYTAQAGLDQAEAEEAPIGADLSAAGNLLSSASSIGTKWYSQTGGASTSKVGTDPTYSNYGFNAT
jgi:hypothetical protein